MTLEISGRPGARPLAILLAGLTVIFATGCGSDEDGAGEKPSMLSAAPRAPEDSSSGSGLNNTPVIEAIEIRPAVPAPGRTISATASVTDEDGDATRVRYVWQSSTGRVLGEGRRFKTGGFEQGDRLQVMAIATDGESESEPFTRDIRLAESSIEVSLVAIDASEGTKPGSVFESVVESTDEDAGGYDVLLEWEVNGKVVASSEELDTTPFAPGDVVRLRARLDFDDHTSRAARSGPVKLTRGDAPKIVSQPLAGIEGGMFKYQIQAKSSEPGAQLSYELLEGPEGMNVDVSSGLVTWRPGSEQRGGFKIEVVARDQWGSGSAQAFSIQVDGPAAPPASAR